MSQINKNSMKLPEKATINKHKNTKKTEVADIENFTRVVISYEIYETSKRLVT